jgi:hypothetical protein
MMKRLLTFALLALAIAAPIAVAELAADAKICIHPAVTQALS